LPLALQAKILRALEERRFERVGGTASLHVDVRVVAATNRHLKAAVAARQFREDLYFRLSVFPITIPPLRERAKDIPTLAMHFLQRFCQDLNKPSLTFAPSAIEALLAHTWRGNVRELQNCIERAVILTDGNAIHGRHLQLAATGDLSEPAGAADPWEQIDLSGSLADSSKRLLLEGEKRAIAQALRRAGGHTGMAAEMLQVNYKVLLARIKQYQLDDLAR